MKFYKELVPLFLLIIQFSSGEDARLVCKTDSENSVNYHITDADYVVLNASIGSVFDDLSMKIQMMEDRIFSNVYSYFLDTQRNIFNDIQNAVVHKGIYYWVVIHDTDNMNYAEAETICIRRGGKPADIKTKIHLQLIRSYLDFAMKKWQTTISVWLGMTFSHEHDHIMYSYGKLAPDYDLHPEYPSKNLQNTGIAIAMSKDKDEKKVGIHNYSPLATTHGVLCEK